MTADDYNRLAALALISEDYALAATQLEHAAQRAITPEGRQVLLDRAMGARAEALTRQHLHRES